MSNKTIKKNSEISFRYVKYKIRAKKNLATHFSSDDPPASLYLVLSSSKYVRTN